MKYTPNDCHFIQGRGKKRPSDVCMGGFCRRRREVKDMDKDGMVLELLNNDFSTFNMQGFIYDPHTPKQITYAQKEICAYHNCTCEAINSHLLQKNKWLKRIAEEGKVLQMCDSQMQPLLDGNENGNNYTLLSIKDALSLPIFCKKHDQKLFKEFEVKELDLKNEIHFLKLSYRAFCAIVAQEKRRRLFYDINPQINTYCSGPIYDELCEYSDYVIGVFEKYLNDLYKLVKAKDTSDYIFKVVQIDRLRLCLSDVYITEDILIDAYQRKENSPLLFPIFMHALPYDNESVLIYGYNKNQCNNRVKYYIDKWTKSVETSDIIDDWLVLANNWCVAPSFFGNCTKEKCLELMCRKVKL